MIERSEIQWGKTPIPYIIRRTGREKTVALTVERHGKLVVSAPIGVPVDRLNGIVRHKALWVTRRIRRVSDLPPAPLEREFVSGEAVRYLGRQYRLRVYEAGNDARARIWAGGYEVPVPPGLGATEQRREVRRRLAESLRGRAALYLPERLAGVCGALRVARPTIIVREQAKRWGSCDRTGMLRINWRVIQAPVSLIDYVLVHELVHLGNPSHDRRFWDAINRWAADYEQRRARLRELGPSLVW